MSLWKKILSPITRIVPSSLKFGKTDKGPHNPPPKQSTTHYACMFELHEYNKRKTILQNSKIEH